MKRRRKRTRKPGVVSVVLRRASTKRRLSDGELAKRIIAMDPQRRQALMIRLSKLSAAPKSPDVKTVNEEAANSTYRMSNTEMVKIIVSMDPQRRQVLMSRLSKLSAAPKSPGVKTVEVKVLNDTMRHVLLKLARNPHARASIRGAMSAAWCDIGRALREGLMEERRALTYERP